MNIRTFDLERIQSLYENTVQYNLTESGFHPYTLAELLTAEQLKDIQQTVLGYGQTNGSIALRQRIASLYPHTDESQVLVTNGSSEANFIACHTLLNPGDEVVLMSPNYLQIWGIAEELGANIRFFTLKEDRNWAPDLAELESQVSEKTKMIAICNPNNPTGYTLTQKEMEHIVSIAENVGAWIYADEVYRGAELSGEEIPSFWGMYDKVMVNGGLSKAYALPGLRLGWLVGPASFISNSWAYSDYTSITAGILSHKVAEIALVPAKRMEILTRNRNMLNENLTVLKKWVDEQGGAFSFVAPKAGGMVFLRFQSAINSTELSDRLRKENDVFVLAGDCFGMDQFIRIGIGAEKEYLQAGLERISQGWSKLHG